MDPPSKAASIVDMYALPLCALNCTTFAWKCLLGFNTDLIIMPLGIFPETTCWAMTETAERAAIWRLSPLYTGFRPDASVT